MDAHLKGKASEGATLRDPVCGMGSPISRSGGKATPRGVTYPFCSRERHMKSQADPGAHVETPEVT